jgi:hypothetical protein
VHRSGVADANTGASLTSDIRTSSGMFYSRGQTELIRRIEERIARWTMLPAGNGEGIQVLRYEVGGCQIEAAVWRVDWAGACAAVTAALVLRGHAAAPVPHAAHHAPALPAAWLMFPQETQQYKPHHDYFSFPGERPRLHGALVGSPKLPQGSFGAKLPTATNASA